MTAIVYFAQVGTDGPIKIGTTTSEAEDRITALQVGCPWKINILGWVAGESRHEGWLHRRFAAFRLEGEWFDPVDEILVAIREILRPEFTWPEHELPLPRSLAGWRGDLNHAVHLLGSQSRLAEAMGCSQSKISWLLISAEQIGAEDALAVHRATKGAVTASSMRPDLWPSEDHVPIEPSPTTSPTDPAPSPERAES